MTAEVCFGDVLSPIPPRVSVDCYQRHPCTKGLFTSLLWTNVMAYAIASSNASNMRAAISRSLVLAVDQASSKGSRANKTASTGVARQSLSYVSYKDRKTLADAMREIYTAQSEQAAHRALDKLDQTWSKRYPMIAASWRRRWTELTPFLAYPAELRRMVYTTNAIESLHHQLRKVIKTKGHFPTAQAAMKGLYLALRDIDARRKKPMTGWKQIYNQLIILFGQERVEGIKH